MNMLILVKNIVLLYIWRCIIVAGNERECVQNAESFVLQSKI